MGVLRAMEQSEVTHENQPRTVLLAGSKSLGGRASTYSRTRNIMRRKLHYKVISFGPIPAEHWQIIRSVLKAMNERFTWSCENLKLEPVREEERQQGYFIPWTSTGPTVQAYGFTKVLDDEWNAALVIQFAKWLSKLLPKDKIEVSDEGDFVSFGDLIFEAGRASPDAMRIVRRLTYLMNEGFKDEFSKLVSASADAREHGCFYADVPASNYADRKEIAVLELPNCAAGLSLDEVAERMRFPWQDDAA